MVSAVANSPILYSPSTVKELDQWEILFIEIPEEDRVRIEKNLVKDQKRLNEVYRVLLNCDWKNSLFLDDDITFCLLSLFKEKRISITVLATSMYYLHLVEVYDFKGVHVLDLFSNGTINKIALSLIKFTMLDGSKSLYGEHTQDVELNDRELVDLFFSMQSDKVHPCEKVLFYTRDREGIPLPGQKFRSISQEIQARLGFNFFGRVNDHILYPSAKLCETFMETKFGENEIICCIYLFAMPIESTLLKWQLNNVRVKTIPAPKLDLKQYPSEVDHYVARGLDTTKHDEYHQYRCSCVFKEHRPLITALAIQYNQIIVANRLGTLAHKILFRLNGLEMMHYPRGRRINKNVTNDSKSFWQALRDTIYEIEKRDAEKLKNHGRHKLYKNDLNWLIICIARTFFLYGEEIENVFKVALNMPSDDNNKLFSKPFFKQIKSTIDELKRKIKPLSNDPRGLIERIVSPRWENKN